MSWTLFWVRLCTLQIVQDEKKFTANLNGICWCWMRVGWGVEFVTETSSVAFAQTCKVYKGEWTNQTFTQFGTPTFRLIAWRTHTLYFGKHEDATVGCYIRGSDNLKQGMCLILTSPYKPWKADAPINRLSKTRIHICLPVSERLMNDW